MTVTLIKGDCLEKMKDIPDGAIDMVLTDPPYGTTVCKWDSVIDLSLMWEQLNRVIKPSGAIVLTGTEPFSSSLRLSNLGMYKYDWVWVKSKSQHFAQAPYRPMTNHELISVFSKGGTAKNATNRMFYKPQGTEICNRECKGKPAMHSDHRNSKTDQANYTQTTTGYPKTILTIGSVGKSLHPTQKPVALMEYLIKTYTNEGETVLDFTMGSGTTGVACKNLNRDFVGIELDGKYFSIAEKRINDNNNCAQEPALPEFLL